MPKLTEPRRAALEALAAAYPDYCSRSNSTEGRRVYWQTADWAVAEGLAAVADGEPVAYFVRFRLTAAGAKLCRAEGIPVAAELWWHRYQAMCPHGLFMASEVGDSPLHPEQLAAEEKLSYRSPMLGCDADCRVEMRYVRSWNHEPTDAERDAVTPESLIG